MGRDKPDNLENEIKKIIADTTGISRSNLDADADLWKDFRIDSLKALEVIIVLEKRYKIKIRDENLPKLSSVNKAVEIVRLALKKQSIISKLWRFLFSKGE
ncbi:MAG: acyl carrier protein [Candidatus Omnitrophica bacterium]|nr:acyl carrier protein [Candidatus Omnitrophota bacterium]